MSVIKKSFVTIKISFTLKYWRYKFCIVCASLNDNLKIKSMTLFMKIQLCSISSSMNTNTSCHRSGHACGVLEIHMPYMLVHINDNLKDCSVFNEEELLMKNILFTLP